MKHTPADNKRENYIIFYISTCIILLISLWRIAGILLTITEYGSKASFSECTLNFIVILLCFIALMFRDLIISTHPNKEQS